MHKAFLLAMYELREIGEYDLNLFLARTCAAIIDEASLIDSSSEEYKKILQAVDASAAAIEKSGWKDAIPFRRALQMAGDMIGRKQEIEPNGNP